MLVPPNHRAIAEESAWGDVASMGASSAQSHVEARTLRALIDFLATDSHRAGCGDADLDLATFDSANGDADLIANHQRLSNVPCQNEHGHPLRGHFEIRPK